MTGGIGTLTAETQAEVGQRVSDILDRARAPGALIAVVSREAILLHQGVGLRAIAAEREAWVQAPNKPYEDTTSGTREPTVACRARYGAAMTEATLYPIASTSKALTATLLARLVSAGQLDWDVPIRTYFPDFALADKRAGAEATLRDLMNMRTGLPRHDWSWIGADVTRAELVGRMAKLESASAFRERFHYNNLTVTAAGYIAECVTGETWEDLVIERVCMPLGMTGVRAVGLETMSAPPGAITAYHHTPDRHLARTPWFRSAATGPSGGTLWATIGDMALWAHFNLGDGAALLPTGVLAVLQSPAIPTDGDAAAPSDCAFYGFGWFVDTYRGQRRVSHGGYLSDINSEIALYPKLGLGIVTVCNLGPPRLARLLAEEIFDIVADRAEVPLARNRGSAPTAQKAMPNGNTGSGGGTDRVERHLAAYEAAIAERARAAAKVFAAATDVQVQDLGAYAGHYAHPGYGRLAITAKAGGLVLQFGERRIPLRPGADGRWLCAPTPDLPLDTPHPFDHDHGLRFESGSDNVMAAVHVALEPAVSPICFERMPFSDRGPAS